LIKYIPVISAGLLIILLGGCVDLPGSDPTEVNRFALLGPQGSCSHGKHALALSIVSVGSGLENDRVAQLNEQTGELTYLKGLRWAQSLGSMLEQRMAADLECAGFIVQTGHHSRLGRSQLLCEVRALNLVTAVSVNKADVAISCLYQESNSLPERALIESARVPLEHWSKKEAMRGLSQAYQQTFQSLVQEL
jgi:ABC-type uncharacterized transport system auxiliary subunit